MPTVYIALGSNLANPLEQLKQALNHLRKFSKNIEVSPFYASKPLGPQDQPDYVNAVVKCETSLSPLDLLDELQAIENKQGRVRLRRWGERTLDLDILLYDNQQIENERLTIPHYDMCNRAFVIVPLYDLAPNLVLPDGTKLNFLYRKYQDHQMQHIVPEINKTD